MFGQLPQTGWKRRPPRIKQDNDKRMFRPKINYNDDQDCCSTSHCQAKKHVMVNNRVLVKWSLFISLFLLINLSSVYSHPYLIFSNKRDIRLYEVQDDSSSKRSRPKTTPAVKGLEDAAALDYFVKDNRICWTEISLMKIRCSVIDPNKKGAVAKKTIVGTGLLKPEGLACDWINNKIYWTDSETKRIEVASLESQDNGYQDRRVLVWEDLDQPRSIAVSPKDGLMFWSDWGEYPKIERIGMDGNPDTRMILKGDGYSPQSNEIAWPNGLTLDYENRLLYWVEAKEGMQHIGVMNWEGGNQGIILEGKKQLPQPYAISIYETELYWTDWSTNSIHIYNFTEGLPNLDYDDDLYEPAPGRVKFGDRLEPMDIKVFDPSRQKESLSPCLNSGCSHMCLAAPIPQRYACSCPTGIRLINNRTCANGYNEILLLSKRDDLRKISLDTPDFTDIVVVPDNSEPQSDFSYDEYEDQVTIVDDDGYTMAWDINAVAIDYDPVEEKAYWTDQVKGIFKVFLNGSDVEGVITTNVDHPDGLAVDWLGRNLYWTDTGTDRIEVAKLDGSSRKVLISRFLDEPRDITLDPIHGWMYWSDWGEKAKIEKSWMDGSHRSVLINKDIVWPNGIALDVDEQILYWCDAKTDRIESINVDGSNRKVIINDILPHPFGLTILGDYIYWTDWQEHTVERAEKISGKDRMVLISHLDNLMSLQAAAIRPDQTWYNPCKKDNGGCSHLCLMTPRGRVCGCPDGQELKVFGGTDCIVPDAFMMYASPSSIGRVSINAPASEDHILPIHELSRVSSLDFDMSDGGRMYWSELNNKKKDPKTISRSFLNGTNVEVIIEFGLESPDGIAVDWIANNIYWCDSVLKRIQVSNSDGTSKRVILWKNLGTPIRIALDPERGHIYWLTSGDSPVIERACLDGSNREMFITKEDLVKPNGLAIDYESRRLYWTDSGRQAISYKSLEKDKTKITTIVHPGSDQLQSLTIYKSNVYWAELDNQLVRKANKYTGGSQSIFQNRQTKVSDLFVYHESRQKGTNPCAKDNGGCSELCLFTGKNDDNLCSCPSHHFLSKDKKSCNQPNEFLLFGQKNKISRLLLDENEVSDLVLPVRGARDIWSIDYDPYSRLIYWIDHGSKKKSEDSQKTSIKRAFDNGTLHPEKRLHYDKDNHSLKPYDLKVDWNTRLLFWTCEHTNSINVTRLDYLEDYAFDTEEDVSDFDGDNEANNNPTYIVGSILSGGDDKPRSIAIHPYKSMVFWVNMATPVRIESARMDGRVRKTIVQNNLQNPSDLTVDVTTDKLYWCDKDLKKIETSDLYGNHRKVLVSEKDAHGLVNIPVAIAVLGDFLYWADRSEKTISRVNKETGKDLEIVLSDVHHLSSLTAVIRPLHPENNPCVIKDCSHICLFEDAGKSAKCSCPSDSGLEITGAGNICKEVPNCKNGEFTCPVKKDNGRRCIPLQWRCDGSVECGDHGDEIDCPECGPGKFRCRTGQCIESSKLCDGTNDCDDQTDESQCCGSEEFMCVGLKGGKRECVAKTKLCDEVNDCSDASDEEEPTCNAIGITSAGSAPNSNDQSSNTTPILIAVIAGVVFVIACIVFATVLCSCKRKKDAKFNNHNQNNKFCSEDEKLRHPLNLPSTSSVPSKYVDHNMLPCNSNSERGLAAGAANLPGFRSNQPRSSPTGHALYPSQSVDIHNVIADSNSNNLDSVPVANSVARIGGPPSPNAGVASGIGCGSSNGLMYDRSHVTGASSSTTSSSGNYAQNLIFGAPPPSPSTSVDMRSRMTSSNNYPNTSTHHRQHRSMHSLPRSGRHHNRAEKGPPSAYRHYNSKNQPPPPTPCSTDVAEESGSDVYGAYGVVQQPRSGYDSEPYEGGLLGGCSMGGARNSSNNPRRAPPSSPYISDGEGQDEDYGSDILQCPPDSQQRFNDHLNSQVQLQSSAPPPSPEPPSTPGQVMEHEY